MPSEPMTVRPSALARVSTALGSVWPVQCRHSSFFWSSSNTSSNRPSLTGADGEGAGCGTPASHSAKGAASTLRGYQAGRPPLYELEADIHAITLPALIICGDEEDACIEPSGPV